MTEDEIEALERSLDDTGSMASAFSAELSRLGGTLGQTSRELGGLERGFSRGIRRAVDGVLLDGQKLSDALTGVARSMSETVFSQAMRPVKDRMGGMLSEGVNSLVAGLMPFQQGGAFSGGRVTPFARGGVVSGPTSFPMRGGAGLMGEAGPEAIMPLTRGSDGRLGVAAQGGSSPQVTINISTPDVEGFRRSRSQVAAQMLRALGQGRRNG